MIARRLLVAAVVCVAVAVAGCGDDDDVTVNPGTATGSATATANVSASPTVTPEPTSPPNTSQSLESVIVSFSREGGPDISLSAEVADSAEERSIGLMNRETLGEDDGMLFVHDEDTTTGFWMQNTLIPLTVAFIGADKTIIGFADMEPQTTIIHNSPAPWRYAVEANRGWFAGNGVKEGATVDLGGLQ